MVLKGNKNISYLKKHDVSIWDEWADESGDLGPVYGFQWRNWPKLNGGHINQIANIVNLIKHNPDSRRIIVSTWNVSDIENMKLPPCHVIFQFYVAEGKLLCQMYQRSADLFLGVPFNVASFALLTMKVAQVCDLEPYEFINTFGDTHIYLNYIEQVNLQLTRFPKSYPKMIINKEVKDIFPFKYEDFHVDGYESYLTIKAPIAI